jgi:hypothetical protein
MDEIVQRSIIAHHEAGQVSCHLHYQLPPFRYVEVLDDSGWVSLPLTAPNPCAAPLSGSADQSVRPVIASCRSPTSSTNRRPPADGDGRPGAAVPPITSPTPCKPPRPSSGRHGGRANHPNHAESRNGDLSKAPTTATPTPQDALAHLGSTIRTGQLPVSCAMPNPNNGQRESSGEYCRL